MGRTTIFRADEDNGPQLVVPAFKPSPNRR